jgi:hypothetical protein
VLLSSALYPAIVSRATESYMRTAAEPKPNGGQRKTTFRRSKDGKWRSFSRSPHLLQYVSSGTYFARIKVKGKIIRESNRFAVPSWRAVGLGWSPVCLGLGVRFKPLSVVLDHQRQLVFPGLTRVARPSATASSSDRAA